MNSSLILIKRSFLAAIVFAAFAVAACAGRALADDPESLLGLDVEVAEQHRVEGEPNLIFYQGHYYELGAARQHADDGTWYYPTKVWNDPDRKGSISASDWELSGGGYVSVDSNGSRGSSFEISGRTFFDKKPTKITENIKLNLKFDPSGRIRVDYDSTEGRFNRIELEVYPLRIEKPMYTNYSALKKRASSRVSLEFPLGAVYRRNEVLKTQEAGFAYGADIDWRQGFKIAGMPAEFCLGLGVLHGVLGVNQLQDLDSPLILHVVKPRGCLKAKITDFITISDEVSYDWAIGVDKNFDTSKAWFHEFTNSAMISYQRLGLEYRYVRSASTGTGLTEAMPVQYTQHLFGARVKF